MPERDYVKSHSFKEKYVLKENQSIVQGIVCPIDITPLVSNGLPEYSCLACGAQYPKEVSNESIKEYASKYARDLEEKLRVTGKGIKVEQIFRTIRIIDFAKKQGLIEKLK